MTSQATATPSATSIPAGSSVVTNSYPNILVSDLLTRCTTTNIFHGLVRDVDSVYARLSDASEFTVILAPQDTTMVQLPRKPWETLDDFASFGLRPYEGDEGQSRAKGNLERFVEDHVIVDPIFMTQDTHVKTLSGSELWYEIGKHSDYQTIEPAHVEIVEMYKAKNGAIWVLKDTLTKK